VVKPDDHLKVLHIGPTPFFSDRGCHIRIRGLAAALQRRGVESWLCTYGLGRDVPEVETERIAQIPGYRRVDAGPSVFKYLADVMLLFKVCGSILRRRPDVLHGHLHEGALIGQAARTLLFWRRLPLIFDMQGSLTGELEQYGYLRFPPVRWIFHSVEWLIDRLPDRIAGSSAGSLAIAHERFGIPRERLALVPDGSDIEEPDAEELLHLREELALPSKRTIVAFTGSLLAVKGVDALHAVIAACAARDLPVHFLIVGYPVEGTRRFLCDHGLEPFCSLTGRVRYEQIGRYLALADVAIEPKAAASGEASGKLLNYMAAGLPVACFDTENNREMLGESGCYASVGDAEALVEAVAELVRDPQRAEQMGATARARVIAEYSWDASASTLLDLYHDSLGS
jgi:glycosyltransferase involved in cell wall biosynthesis